MGERETERQRKKKLRDRCGERGTEKETEKRERSSERGKKKEKRDLESFVQRPRKRCVARGRVEQRKIQPQRAGRTNNKHTKTETFREQEAETGAPSVAEEDAQVRLARPPRAQHRVCPATLSQKILIWQTAR